jgi:hypothetical protein
MRFDVQFFCCHTLKIQNLALPFFYLCLQGKKAQRLRGLQSPSASAATSRPHKSNVYSIIYLFA